MGCSLYAIPTLNATGIHRRNYARLWQSDPNRSEQRGPFVIRGMSESPLPSPLLLFDFLT